MTAAEECDLGCGSGVQISYFLELCRPGSDGQQRHGTDWRVYSLWWLLGSTKPTNERPALPAGVSEVHLSVERMSITCANAVEAGANPGNPR